MRIQKRYLDDLENKIDKLCYDVDMTIRRFEEIEERRLKQAEEETEEIEKRLERKESEPEISANIDSWEGIDAELWEALMRLRRIKAKIEEL